MKTTASVAVTTPISNRFDGIHGKIALLGIIVGSGLVLTLIAIVNADKGAKRKLKAEQRRRLAAGEPPMEEMLEEGGYASRRSESETAKLRSWFNAATLSGLFSSSSSLHRSARVSDGDE